MKPWTVIFLLFVGSLLLSFAPALAQESPAPALAIVGDDGNLYLYDIASQSLTPLTQDARLNSPQRFYSWPTWASDGQLAYFGLNRDPQNAYSLGVFIRRVGDESAKGVFSSTSETFTYAHWSPGDCGAAGCRDLALLYTTMDGLATRLIRSDGTYEVSEVSQGGPHYWDWSPDGSQMIWARYASDYELYDVENQDIAALSESQGQVNAPDWSPVDDRLLLGVAAQGRGQTDLIIVEGDERETIIEGLRGILAYAWSEDAEHIAYLIRNTGALSLYELSNAAETNLETGGVLAFLWSPDGRKLAYLTLENLPNNPGTQQPAPFFSSYQGQTIPNFQWKIHNLDTGLTRAYNGFVPTDDMIYYLNFFDQFSRSHRLWSPDSRYMVYGQRENDGALNVVLLDTESSASGQRIIAPGTIGVFGW